MFELTVRTRFAAAHFLRDYQGPCARLHGHTWMVEADFQGRRLDQQGMLLDFRLLKNSVRVVIERLDHQNLNDLPPFQAAGGGNPTAENLARWIFYALRENLADLAPEVHIVKVRVYESPEAGAAYWEGE